MREILVVLFILENRPLPVIIRTNVDFVWR